MKFFEFQENDTTIEGVKMPEKLNINLYNRDSDLTDAFLTIASQEDEDSIFEALRTWFGDEVRFSTHQRSRLFAAIDQLIVQLNTLIYAQLDAILHHPRFQQLEASWRGVAYLIKQFDPSEEEIRLRIIHWQWAELSADLENALEFDQSQLFKKIYAEHLDTPGGKPFGVLIGDYYVQHRRNRANPDDITTLGKLSEVASAALCPFITSCRPSMFGLNSFAELEMPSELSSAFNPQSDSDNRRWLEFRNSDEARFIGIVLPHILMRLPYGYDNPDLHHPCYYERVENPDHAGREASGIRNYLWGNAAYAFGAVLIRAFLNYGWFADIRGLRVDENDGGIINDLPVPWFETDPKQVVYKYSTEVAITERRAAELTDLGFISLVRVKDTRYSWFFSCPSVQLPQTYEFSEDLVSINARMSAMLNYILCVSRFGHYIKQIIRDRRVGALTNAGEIKKYISDEFLFKYRESNESASSERKAAAPLKDYEVEVQQMPGRPGNYACTIYLQPHYQFDYVDAKIRLLTEFAPAEP